jgi:hypothetical protein
MKNTQFFAIDAGPPLQRSNNRTVTIQMLTPNNSGSRVRERNGTLLLMKKEHGTNKNFR